MDDDDTTRLALFQRAQAAVTDRIDALQAAQWDAVVLPGWTAADLVAHLVAGQSALARLLAGAAVGPAPVGSTAEQLGSDPLGAWEAAADAALTRCAQPGALAGTVPSPTGALPARHHVVRSTTELTVHAWDLAAGSGGVTRLDPSLVWAALADTEQRPGAAGIPGPVAPARSTPEDADPQIRLLARFGRSVP